MTTPLLFVGIDVAKAECVVTVRPTGATWTVPQTEAGWTALAARLQALAPTLVLCEATGGLEVPLASVLAATGVPLAIVNPRQVRDFAKAKGLLAKTDALDAAVLAHFAEALRPLPRPVPDATTQTLAALVTRRRQLVEMRTAEENRLGSAPHPSGPGSRATFGGSSGNSAPWTRTSLGRSAATQRGGSRMISSGAPRAWAPFCRSPSWAASRNSEPSPGGPSPPWWGSRPGPGTVAATGARGVAGVAGPMSGPCCTWPPWRPCGAIPCSGPSTSASWRRGNSRRSPSSPACGSCSRS